MSDDESFADLMQRIRGGDEKAADELWKRYEPFIRREWRIRMRLPSMKGHWQFDVEELAQSIFKSFFIRAALGEYELKGWQDLKNLLRAMVRNKTANRFRFNTQQRRDVRRNQTVEAAAEAPAREPSPSHAAEVKDMLEKVRELLSEEERPLMELKQQGCTFEEIAAQMGGTAPARRKQWDRVKERILKQLGLTEDEGG